MFIVTPDTVLNPGALLMKQVPRRFFGRANLWPRRGAGYRTTLRMFAELQALRYTIPLLPLLVIGFTWTQTALPLAQAPILMVLLIGLVEMRLLRYSPEARARISTPDEAARTLDLLAAQARPILTRIAAGRALGAGRVHLVVEQSELARIAPLTYVSMQVEPDDGRPKIMALTAEEMALIRDGLFLAPLSERTLFHANAHLGQSLRVVSLDTAQVSAHARLAALMARSNPSAPATEADPRGPVSVPSRALPR
jgi:hypothetical protein